MEELECGAPGLVVVPEEDEITAAVDQQLDVVVAFHHLEDHHGKGAVLPIWKSDQNKSNSDFYQNIFLPKTRPELLIY